jgi:hypothetical protein
VFAAGRSEEVLPFLQPVKIDEPATIAMIAAAEITFLVTSVRIVFGSIWQ